MQAMANRMCTTGKTVLKRLVKCAVLFLIIALVMAVSIPAVRKPLMRRCEYLHAKLLWHCVVKKELKVLNPGVLCEKHFTKNEIGILLGYGGKIVLGLDGLAVSDLTPCKVLPVNNLVIRDTQVSDLSFTTNMPLELVSIENSPIDSLSALPRQRLTMIHLNNVFHLTDLSPLAGMPLTLCSISYCKNITNISALANMPITYLNLRETPVTDLTPLKNCFELSLLNISDTNVKDLTPLSRLSNLRRLTCRNTQITDFSPLQGLKKLEYLDISGTTAFSSFDELPEWMRAVKEVVMEFGMEAALEDWNGGLSKFVRVAQMYHWQAPRIPSKWSVERRPGSEEQQKASLAGRNFGEKLADKLRVISFRLQDPKIRLKLMSRHTHLLCDLSDWCASTPGYGNLFLAQRCLDVAAVGLARLVACPDFPLADCEKLALRMTPTWMSVEARSRVLNDEVGTNLFAVEGTQENMEKIWEAGSYLMRKKKVGEIELKEKEPGCGFIDISKLKANLDFFEDDNESNKMPLTVFRLLDSKRHALIVRGLDLENVDKALTILAFRSVTGQLPEDSEFTEEQLSRYEEVVAQAVKYGITMGRMKGVVVDSEQVLDQRSNKGSRQGHALYAVAWQAYNEVKSGKFFDQDTREKRSNKLLGKIEALLKRQHDAGKKK